MIINYDIPKINNALQDFYNATGIEIGLLKPDFSPACERHMENIPYCQAVQNTAIGEKNCKISDAELLKKSRASKRTEMSICHAGLLNIVIPLLYDDIIIGYIIFGCIKPNRDFMPLPKFKNLQAFDTADMQKYYDDIPSIDNIKIQSISNIAIMLAKYILLKNMLKPEFGEAVQKTIEYINNNLDGDLSIATLTKNTNISKSVLYKKFDAIFHCTVSEYIKTKRVERSIELMKSGNMSIEEIAQKSGFSSASYYSRIFKKHTGISPAKYKKK